MGEGGIITGPPSPPQLLGPSPILFSSYTVKNPFDLTKRQIMGGDLYPQPAASVFLYSWFVRKNGQLLRKHKLTIAAVPSCEKCGTNIILISTVKGTTSQD